MQASANLNLDPAAPHVPTPFPTTMAGSNSRARGQASSNEGTHSLEVSALGQTANKQAAKSKYGETLWVLQIVAL